MSNDKVEVFKAEDFREYVTMTVVGQMPIAAMIARHANRLLAERSQVVYGRKDRRGLYTWDVERYSSGEKECSALLVGVTEIRKDTAEDVVRAVVDAFADGTSVEVRERAIARARRLIGRKGWA